MFNLIAAMTPYGEVEVEPLRFGSPSFEPWILQGSPHMRRPTDGIGNTYVSLRSDYLTPPANAQNIPCPPECGSAHRVLLDSYVVLELQNLRIEFLHVFPYISAGQ
jgi:hypothetical protein